MLPPKNRLQSKEIKKILNIGEKHKGEYGMFVVVKTDEDTNRYAFVVSKKIGNAVQRNKMTRLLRESTRKNEQGKGIKGVYVAFKYCEDYERLNREVKEQLKDASRDT